MWCVQTSTRPQDMYHKKADGSDGMLAGVVIKTKARTLIIFLSKLN
jgi:hypothetical protein